MCDVSPIADGVPIRVRDILHNTLYIDCLLTNRKHETSHTLTLCYFISSPHACRKRRLNGDSPSNEKAKSKAPCHSRRGPTKMPSYSKAVSAEHFGINYAALQRQWRLFHCKIFSSRAFNSIQSINRE